jgi:hypothetical protein
MVREGLRVYSRTMKIKLINLLSQSSSVRGVRQFTTAIACCGTLGLLAGCASEPESHVVSAPPPPAPTRSVTTTTVTTTPEANPVVYVGGPANGLVTTATPAVSTTVVTVAPPALQAEVVLAQPSPKYVWLAGYWSWRNDQYQWMSGHWQLPPSSSATWVAPRWEQQGNAYKFTEGYWN